MKVQKKTRYLLVVIILCVAGILAFFLRGRILGQQDASIERIVLITIDTLRADHLGSYGYIQDTSPFLDRLFKQSVFFKNAVVPMSTTSPSHASLLTSLYPVQHGVMRNDHQLADSFVTMAEIFQEMGYKTAGIVSTDYHFISGNMNQGFDYFDEPILSGFELTKAAMQELKDEGIPVGVIEALKPLKWKAYAEETGFLEAVEKHIGKDRLDQYKEVIVTYAYREKAYREAPWTIETALAWLDTVKPSQKLFLWIHVFDPHWPLQPSEQVFDQLTNAVAQDKLYTFLVEQQHIEPGFFKFNNDKNTMLELITRYDGEIRAVDAELQRFYEHYQQKGFHSDSLWVITADHGEGLGSHFWWEHRKHLYNEQLRVPLVFHFSAETQEGKVIEDVVENVDAFPTIFELVDKKIALPEDIEGESLVPLMFPKDGRVYPKTYAFSQRQIFNTPCPEDVDPKELNCEEGEKYALQSQEYKYIYFTQGEDEFFDLQRDPHEVHNLINSGSLEEQQLKEALLMRIEGLEQGASSEHLTVDDETIEKLKSVGYIH